MFFMRLIIFISFVCSFISLLACDIPNNRQVENTEIKEDSIPFLSREVAGKIENIEIDEASGIVASRSFPGHFWTHNDSGDYARLFFIDETGQTVSEVKIAEATNRDWEDITIFYDKETQKNYILIADIGDNKAQYEFLTLYMIEEPSTMMPTETTLPIYKKMILKYPNGKRDAETVMVDPKTQDIYIVSKREPQVFLYHIAYPYPLADTIVPQKILTLPLTQIVAGDISPDGKEILLKNYDFIYYYKRENNETISQALAHEPLLLAYTKEPQGEAICFSHDATSFFTVSEKSPLGITPILYRYRRK